jgi:hypothetical protein
MSFNTNIPNHVLIGDEDVVFGTCMLGTVFGEIMKCDLDRSGNEIEIEKGTGGLLALIIANPKFALDLETVFTDAVTPPELGQSITFPLAGVTGRILSVKPGWTNKGSRMLSIKAAYWDSMDVEGTNPAFSVDLSGTTTPIS